MADDGSASPNLPDDEGRGKDIVRFGLQAASGLVPFAGGLLSAIASSWSEKEQKRWNEFLRHWAQMLEDELREKQQTIVEIVARLDAQDDEIQRRVKSEEYQTLLKKAFRDWGATESETKRVYIRNILSHAAATKMTSDDVVRLFLDWISRFSELHFAVVGAIYNSEGITRAQIWTKIGKGSVREDSAEADLYKLLFIDLSTGHLIRQHRETDYNGNFIRKSTRGRQKAAPSPYMASAFDDEKGYVLTELGRQFVHYAMTDIPPKIRYDGSQAAETNPA